jgi:glycosyltransferase involved in cell wall biosynthesis
VAYPRAEEPGSPLFRDLPDPDLATYLTYHVDRVTRIVERERLDVLHANSEVPMSYVAAMVSRRTGVPYVTVAHGSTLEYMYRFDPRYRQLCHIGLLGASGVVALNADVRDRVLTVAPEVAGRLRVVPPGVDCTVFRALSDADRGPALAYVGRISADKGAFLLVGCFPRLAALVPGVRLVVVGDGSERHRLERLSSALGCHDIAEAERVLRHVVQPDDEPWVAALVKSWGAGDGRSAAAPLDVTFTGHLPPPQVAAQMAAADAVVVPSLVREAFPLVVLEALASGTPPLAVDAGGLGAVLAEIAPPLGELGTLLALPADPRLLIRDLPSRVASVLGWMAEPGRRKAARLDCRSLAVETYSWGRVGARLEAVYHEVATTGSLAHQRTPAAAF